MTDFNFMEELPNNSILKFNDNDTHSKSSELSYNCSCDTDNQNIYGNGFWVGTLITTVVWFLVAIVVMKCPVLNEALIHRDLENPEEQK